MDEYSRYILKSMKEKGVGIKELAKKVNMGYMQLYNSLLNEKRSRPLRACEYIKICKVLNLDPFGAQKNC